MSSAKACAQAAVASASKRRRPQRQRQGRPLGHRGSSPLGAALPSDGARGAANAYTLVAPSQQTAFARSRCTAVARTWVSRSRPNRGSGWAEPPCPAVVAPRGLVPKSGLPTARSLRSHRQGASLNTSSLGTLPSFIVTGHGLNTNAAARAPSWRAGTVLRDAPETVLDPPRGFPEDPGPAWLPPKQPGSSVPATFRATTLAKTDALRRFGRFVLLIQHLVGPT